VKPDSTLVQTARGIGISLGDRYESRSPNRAAQDLVSY
jgi:hypothetical protein